MKDDSYVWNITTESHFILKNLLLKINNKVPTSRRFEPGYFPSGIQYSNLRPKTTCKTNEFLES